MSEQSRFTIAWQKLAGVLNAWESSEGPLVNGRKALSQELADAIELAINETADSEPPTQHQENNWEAVLLFDALANSYREFKRLACQSATLEEIDVEGNQALWRAIGSLREWSTTKYNYPLPSPIPVLRNQSVGDEQIARIYGFYDENGLPDLNRVILEEQKPGTYFNPKTWVHPAKKQRFETLRPAIEARKTRGKEYLREEDFGKTAPPSLDDLIKLGAPAVQIARLHNLSIDEAESLLRGDESINEKTEETAKGKK